MAPSGNGKINACSMAVVVAAVWGLCVWGMGVATVYTKTYGWDFVNVLGSIYYGYGPGSWAKAWIGLAWGVGDGFIGTLIIVGLYNLLNRCCRRCRTERGEA